MIILISVYLQISNTNVQGETESNYSQERRPTHTQKQKSVEPPGKAGEAKTKD